MAEQKRTRNYAYRWIEDRFIVAAHSSEPPHREEWEAVCADIATHRNTLRGLLIHTEGGAPTATQRKLLRESVEPMTPPSAILMDSAVVRAVILTLNLFLNNKIKAFSFTDADSALRYIQAPEKDWPLFKKLLREVKGEIGLAGAFSHLVR